MEQHFTNEELQVLSCAILAMQRQLSDTLCKLNNFSQNINDTIKSEYHKLIDLNTKICRYMEE